MHDKAQLSTYMAELRCDCFLFTVLFWLMRYSNIGKTSRKLCGQCQEFRLNLLVSCISFVFYIILSWKRTFYRPRKWGKILSVTEKGKGEDWGKDKLWGEVRKTQSGFWFCPCNAYFFIHEISRKIWPDCCTENKMQVYLWAWFFHTRMFIFPNNW